VLTGQLLTDFHICTTNSGSNINFPRLSAAHTGVHLPWLLNLDDPLTNTLEDYPSSSSVHCHETYQSEMASVCCCRAAGGLDHGWGMELPWPTISSAVFQLALIWTLQLRHINSRLPWVCLAGSYSKSESLGFQVSGRDYIPLSVLCGILDALVLLTNMYSERAVNRANFCFRFSTARVSIFKGCGVMSICHRREQGYSFLGGGFINRIEPI